MKEHEYTTRGVVALRYETRCKCGDKFIGETRPESLAAFKDHVDEMTKGMRIRMTTPLPTTVEEAWDLGYAQCTVDKLPLDSFPRDWTNDQKVGFVLKNKGILESNPYRVQEVEEASVSS